MNFGLSPTGGRLSKTVGGRVLGFAGAMP